MKNKPIDKWVILLYRKYKKKVHDLNKEKK